MPADRPVMADEVETCPRCHALVHVGALVHHLRFHNGHYAPAPPSIETEPVVGTPRMVPFEGPVVWLDTPTTDQREIYELKIRALPIPVLGLPKESLYTGSSPVGQINAVTIARGVVTVEGSIRADLPWVDGRLSCGVDLDVLADLVCHSNGSPWEFVAGGDFPDDLVAVQSGVFRGLTVYLGGGYPAFPDAHIRRIDQ